jgi:hypothetical protein
MIIIIIIIASQHKYFYYKSSIFVYEMLKKQSQFLREEYKIEIPNVEM